jgi:two-component system cell cycle sensor histidine kinase PleC
MVSGRAENSQVALVAKPADVPAIVADKRGVKQVLLNLLSNGVKFTPSGGEVVVDVAHDADDERISIRVTDTGIGIDAADLAKLGRPFEQVDTNYLKAHEGTGLGLALSRSIVELHGGTLEISSTPGEGTSVTVSLPLTARQPAAKSATA